MANQLVTKKRMRKPQQGEEEEGEEGEEDEESDEEEEDDEEGEGDSGKVVDKVDLRDYPSAENEAQISRKRKLHSKQVKHLLP